MLSGSGSVATKYQACPSDPVSGFKATEDAPVGCLRLAFPVGESITLQGRAQDLDRELTLRNYRASFFPTKRCIYFMGSLNYDLSNFKLAIRAFQLVLEQQTDRTEDTS
jgi:hypothetical protein